MNTPPLRIITLPNGNPCSLPTYVGAWRAIKAAPSPAALFPGFGHWPMPAAQILARLSEGVQDRINIRGGLIRPQPSPKRAVANEKRITKQLRKTVKCTCRWCGSRMNYAIHILRSFTPRITP